MTPQTRTTIARELLRNVVAAALMLALVLAAGAVLAWAWP